jgi:hypothetical protein
MFAVGTLVAVVISEPPVADDVSNQPAKLNPALVGSVGNVPMFCPNCLMSVCEVGVPPFPLNVSEMSAGVHLA